MAEPQTTPKIEELRARLRSDPKSRLFYPLAEELRKIGRLDDAKEALLNGLASHPSYLSAWVSLGRVLKEMDNNQGAVDAFNKALSIDPENVVAARLLGESYLALGEKIEAIKKFKLVVALMPGDEEMQARVEALDRELNPGMRAVQPVEVPDLDETLLDTAEGLGEAGQTTTEEPLADEAPLAASEQLGQAAREPEPSAGVVTSVPEPYETTLVLEGLLGVPAAAHEAVSAPFDEKEMEEEAGGQAAPFAEEPAGDADEVFAASATAESVATPVDSSAEEESVWLDEPAERDAPAMEEPPLGVSAGEAAPFSLNESTASEVVGEEPGEVPSLPSAVDAEAADQMATVTMGDLYASQGYYDSARRIYEGLLLRQPGNEELRLKIEALPTTPHGEPVIRRQELVGRLEQWLAKVGRREAGRV
ncbi:MAG TPA: tetratricopeptide repeat protein [Thermoanaerobaculia bacterium]|nr:tetratricopeptide repeat protein [Thermoanaerobaculia bacterium]